MKKIAKALTPLLGLISLMHFGCRTLSTSQESPPSGSAINGMLYYLPVGKITIKGEYTTPEEETPPSDGRSKGTPTPTPTATATGRATATATATSTSTTSPAPELKITLTAEVEADENFGEYYVTPQANYIYDDEVQITVNGKRLLSAGKVTTQDRTVDIVAAVASLVSEIAKGTPALRSLEKPLPFYFSFHPSNPREVNRVKAALSTRKIYFDVTYSGPHSGSGGKNISLSASERQQLGQEGLIFRPGIPYKVMLRYPNTDFDANTLINTTQQFILPDTDRLYEMKYNRMAFVKKVKDIGFTDGMLSDYHQTVPSPIRGFLGLPKAIVQAIVPIPGAAPSGSGSAAGTSGPPNGN
jgi:hypothetical protein